MSTLRETVFDLLFNAFLQIGFFALLTAGFSRFISKAGAKYQHLVYLLVFLLCLTAPIVNTFWRAHPTTIAPGSRPQALSQVEGQQNYFWRWPDPLKQDEHSTVRSEVQEWVIASWGVFALCRLIHFARGIHRVNRLRNEASVLTPAVVSIANRIIKAEHRIALLQSTVIDDPVTFGVLHPAIVLPSKVLPDLCEQDVAAILAHEYGHILRRDFQVHILCELISGPFAWHPGIRYLLSKISQTRELACDDYAAGRLGQRRRYARTLLRLASLCLHTPRGNAVALGIFNGDNLETRIMMLTEKKPLLSRAGVIGLALAMSIPLGAGAVLAHATSLQAGAVSSSTGQGFAGTWHWMFDGKSFSTMILVRDASGFSGSVTGSRIALNDDGGLSRADPAENSAPVPIAKAMLEGSALHVTVNDRNQPFEFTVTLKDETHAEIHPVGAPPNMKPIPAEKVR